MVYISHVRKLKDKVRQSYVIETTWMCKVEEYNAVYRTTTESRVYITQVRISKEKIKQNYVTLCIWMWIVEKNCIVHTTTTTTTETTVDITQPTKC